MAERISPRLRPYGEAVWLLAHRDRDHRPVRCVDRVHDVIVATGEPERLAVDADVPHVGAATLRDGPVRHDLARAEVDHAHASLAVGWPADVRRPAIGDVESGAVAAR